MKAGKFQEAFQQIRGSRKEKRMQRVLYLCMAMSAVILIIQYVFDGKLNTEVLNYVIPVCVASYLVGFNDGRRGIVRGKAEMTF